MDNVDMPILFVTSKDGRALLGVAPRNRFSDVAAEWDAITGTMENKGCAPAYLRWRGNLFRAIEGHFPDVPSPSAGEAGVLIWVPSMADPVTGLLGRQEFLRSMREAIRSFDRDRMERVLLFGDLDRFKYVNDTYGHPAGDTVLRIVAERLRHTVRREDCVIRWGGDEFAIIARFPNVANASGATIHGIVRSLCRKLQAVVEKPIRIAEGAATPIVCRLGISFGYSRFGEAPQDFGTLEQRIDRLVHLADRRMYRAKQER